MAGGTGLWPNDRDRRKVFRQYTKRTVPFVYIRFTFASHSLKSEGNC